MKNHLIKNILIGKSMLMAAGFFYSECGYPAQAGTETSVYQLGQSATLKPSALLQVWTIGNENSSPKNQGVRLRRAEMKVSDTAVSSAKYFFMIDPAKLIPPPGGKTVSVNNMFQDFGLSTEIQPGLELTAGQFKIPTTAEGLDSSASLILPERSLTARTFGDKREMGIKLGYKTDLWNMASMLSSGRAIYGSGTGTFNDLHLRAEMTPFKGYSSGAFITLGNGLDYNQKGRWGINARYNVANAVFRLEYAQGKDGPIQSRGLSSEVAYSATPEIQPVFRFETFAPSPAATTANNLGRAETLGLNYLLPQYNAKLQLAGSLLQNMSAVNGTPTLAKAVNNAEVTLAMQGSI